MEEHRLNNDKIKSFGAELTKVLVPGVGHRAIAKTQEGRMIDSGGTDHTDKFIQKDITAHIEETLDDEQRSDPTHGTGDALQERSQELERVNNVIVQGQETMKSFRELKNDIMQNQDDILFQTDLNLIEKLLDKTFSFYLQKKQTTL